MKRTVAKRKTTTISCDEPSHRFIVAEAERLGITQRALLSRMISSYKRNSLKETEELKSASEFMAIINDKLDKLGGYIRTNENTIGKPTLEKVGNCENLIKGLKPLLEQFLKG